MEIFNKENCVASDGVVLPSFLYKRSDGEIVVQGEDEVVTEEYEEYCKVHNLNPEIIPEFLYKGSFNQIIVANCDDDVVTEDFYSWINQQGEIK